MALLRDAGGVAIASLGPFLAGEGAITRREVDDSTRALLGSFREHATLVRAVVEAAGYDDQIAARWSAIIRRMIDGAGTRLKTAGLSATAAASAATALVWMTERTCYQQAVRGDTDLDDEQALDGISSVWWAAIRAASPPGASPSRPRTHTVPDDDPSIPAVRGRAAATTCQNSSRARVLPSTDAPDDHAATTLSRGRTVARARVPETTSGRGRESGVKPNGAWRDVLVVSLRWIAAVFGPVPGGVTEPAQGEDPPVDLGDARAVESQGLELVDPDDDVVPDDVDTTEGVEVVVRPAEPAVGKFEAGASRGREEGANRGGDLVGALHRPRRYR